MQWTGADLHAYLWGGRNCLSILLRMPETALARRRTAREGARDSREGQRVASSSRKPGASRGPLKRVVAADAPHANESKEAGDSDRRSRHSVR